MHSFQIIRLFASILVILPITSMSAWSAKAEAVKATGGYEANVLPGDAGWSETEEAFLGDFVTVADGVMTYDGSRRPAPTTCGMQPPAGPPAEGSRTLEYRVRCRRIGGDPKQWYQFFLAVYQLSDRVWIRDSLGHYKLDDEPVIHTTCRRPSQSREIPPPTTTGRWDANEWITIRHVLRDAGDGQYHLESWVSGPAGDQQYVDVTREYAGYDSLLNLSVHARTCRDARFDLDYVRWSDQAVPFGTPLTPASTAPEIRSIHPSSTGTPPGAEVTIKGGNFDDVTAVTFGSLPAIEVRRVDPHTLVCRPPRRKKTGRVDVTVTSPHGSAVRRDGFFFGVPPSVSRVEPARGSNRGGERVVLKGAGFQAGARVEFGVQPASTVRVVDAETIICTTPEMRGRWHGHVEVAVINPDGGSATAAGPFRFERFEQVRPKVLGWHLDLVDFNLPLAIQKLEEMPFHGALIRPYRGLHVGSGGFSKEDAELNLRIFEATDFRRFTDNFLNVNFTGPRELPGRGFWEDWSDVLASYARYARLARRAGFKGLWFDVEEYSDGAGPHLASGPYLRQGRSPVEVEQQVKRRARRLMTAVLREYPDITILMTYGLGMRSTPSYDLLPAFCDGLLEAIASDQGYGRARIIDGYEAGYYITTPESYRHAYDRVRKPGGHAYRRTAHPDLWARFGAAAFGNYPDIHDPRAFETQVNSAMNQTDEYVWTYTNGTFFYAWSPPSLMPGTLYADRTERYIDLLCEINGMPRAAPPGRFTRIIDLTLDEGRGRLAKNHASDAFHGRLSADQLWTRDAPELPKLADNRAALDLRGRKEGVILEKTGRSRRSGPTRHMGASHLGGLYFTDHTIEFSFRWDGRVSDVAQYLYGAEGGSERHDDADRFSYGGRIAAGTKRLLHCQRGNYGGVAGCVGIDLERARADGIHRFGRWASVAIRVDGTDVKGWSVFLNGKDVTGADWAGPDRGHPTVEGLRKPYKAWTQHYLPVDLAVGARHRAGQGLSDHFDGMIDAFRITAGQVPDQDLMSVP